MVYDLTGFRYSQWFESIKIQLRKDRYKSKVEVWVAKYCNTDGINIVKPQKAKIRVSYINSSFAIYKVYDSNNVLLIYNVDVPSVNSDQWVFCDSEEELTKVFNQFLLEKYENLMSDIKKLSDEVDIIKNSFYNSDLVIELLSKDK